MSVTATRTIRYVHQPKDAETFALVCPDAILHRDAQGNVTPTRISWYVRHTVGDTSSVIADVATLATYGLTILVSTNTGTTGDIFSIATTDLEEIRIALRRGAEEVDSHTVRMVADGTRGSRGPALRVRAWGDIPNGQPVFSGAEGEDYLDIVIYGTNGDYWQCAISHFKGNPRYPGSANFPDHWRLGTKFEMVATKLLLAQRAKVDNLVVDQLETTRGTGADAGSINCANGLMTVTGSQGHIEFGVDETGYPVLRYYDADGSLLYDLGPQGITMLTAHTSWGVMHLARIASASATLETVRSAKAYISAGTTTTYYRYGAGADDANNGKVYTSRSTSGATIPNGWYCTASMPAPRPGGNMASLIVRDNNPGGQYYMAHLYQFSGGYPVAESTAYWS